MDTDICHIEMDQPEGDSAQDLALIGQVMARIRTQVGRRMIGRTAIANVAPGLDVAQLDILIMMSKAGEKGEVTVGAIAQAMNIDPSRSSRLVADMVSRGILRRDVSQTDARRSILVRTPQGDALLEEARRVKSQILAQVLQGWTPDEIAEFARLFERFTAGFDALYQERG